MQHHRAFSSSALNRRKFLELGLAGAASASAVSLWSESSAIPPALSEAIAKLEYLTRDENFVNVGRGSPPPHQLSAEKRREAGLFPETWQLEVLADSASNVKLGQPLSKENGTALNWEGLMNLAEKRSVRFLHVTSCTNGNAPFGMGLWEGVPLRDVIWMTQPAANVRRVFYHGYHNDNPKQRFQSSLALDRVLEDAPGEMPVILCYKLNGQWLSSKRGGPVRMIVPGRYGNASVKWLQRIYLTNTPQLNDTYSEWNNDTESHLKTCAFFLNAPKTVKAGQARPLTGVAQVGMAGLSKVQYWVARKDLFWPADDPYYAKAEWQDARILPPPGMWGGGFPEGKLPLIPGQIDATGKPVQWPLPNTIAHWAALLPALQAGAYEVRCRTIDANGVAQPMPRPMLKSGNNAIQKVTLTVEG